MGFKEIAMIVVSLILAGILALNIAPSISASGNATKASVLNSEIESIAGAGKMWMANNSSTGTFTGINAEAMTSTIPALTMTGTGATSKFTSKVLNTIEYTIASATTTSADDSIQITVVNLDDISTAEATMASALTAKYGATAVTNTSTTDGTIIVKIQG
jgi:hypothetical protein